MEMSLKEYRSKVEGCWMGKNIGGTLGAPFECRRGVFDVQFYTQELNGEPFPNDDLDLQLIWLNAVEKFGTGTNAQILGEYWHSYITPNWSEYGVGKGNMRMGLVPPFSGYVNNLNRDSCGAFIRSEIWACLAAGHPEIAVKYAYEDAIVDHSYEGVYGEIFCAAIQSSAFVETDKLKLIDIGLSYIPGDCSVAKCVKAVIECYNSNKDFKYARKLVLNIAPATFGMMRGYEDREVETDVPVGRVGFDAPSNIGIMIIGWMYGEDNFGKSLSIAASCGEDADCTAGTLGAILGIIKGIDNIDKRWIEPIGNTIKTISINLADSGVTIPQTIEEMTDRVIKLTPSFLGSSLCDVVTRNEDGYIITMNEIDNLINKPHQINGFASYNLLDKFEKQPFAIEYTSQNFDVVLDYFDEPIITEEVPRRFKLSFENNLKMQQWLNIEWYLPDEWEITKGKNVSVSLDQYHGSVGSSEIEFTVTPKNLTKSRYDIVLAIRSNGRHSQMLIPIVLLT